MDLFDVQARGYRNPLNSREILHLVRSGQLQRRTPCKPRGEAGWRTIDEIFPLLDYGVGGYQLPPDESSAAPHRLALALASILVAVALAAGAFFYWNRAADESTTAVPAKAPPPPAADPVVLVRN